jgi:hypothetical protein
MLIKLLDHLRLYLICPRYTKLLAKAVTVKGRGKSL